MRVTELSLQNFRGFESYTIDFHPQVTVLVGGNGSGKTSVVDGLVAALWNSHAANGAEPGAEFDVPTPLLRETDRRSTRHNLAGILTTEVTDTTKVGADVDLAEWGGFYYVAETPRAPRRVWYRDHSGDISLRWTQRSVRPLLAVYGARRTWPGTGVEPYAVTTRNAAYRDWTNAHTGAGRVIGWFRHFTFVSLQEGEPVPQLEAVKAAIVSSLDDVDDVVFNVREDRLHVIRGDEALPFDLLSDGYKAVIGMVADIAWRAVTLNPQLEDRAATETPGVVLVDELDLHLHPTWQQQILGVLTRAFPKVQFIVTTHSPQILTTAEPEWIRILDGGTEPKRVDRAAGIDANSALEEILGASFRPAWSTRMLNELFEAIDTAMDEETEDADAWTQAETKLLEVEERLGAMEPEVTRARWLIELGKGDA